MANDLNDSDLLERFLGWDTGYTAYMLAGELGLTMGELRDVRDGKRCLTQDQRVKMVEIVLRRV